MLMLAMLISIVGATLWYSILVSYAVSEVRKSPIENNRWTDVRRVVLFACRTPTKSLDSKLLEHATIVLHLKVGLCSDLDFTSVVNLFFGAHCHTLGFLNV